MDTSSSPSTDDRHFMELCSKIDTKSLPCAWLFGDVGQSPDAAPMRSVGGQLPPKVDRSAPLFTHLMNTFATMHSFYEECKLSVDRHAIQPTIAEFLVMIAR